jgi:hypothetical protein
MIPRCWSSGTKIIHAVTLPSSMLQHTWRPVMAPAAMNIGSHESITVRPIQAAPKRRWFSAVIHVPIVNGARLGWRTARPSAHSLPIAARSAAQPSAFAERIPVLPVEWSAWSVSAAAIPLGKRSCSMLIICRFIGIAMVTPSTASRNTHASMSGSESVVLLTSMYAAKAEMSVPPVE